MSSCRSSSAGGLRLRAQRMRGAWMDTNRARWVPVSGPAPPQYRPGSGRCDPLTANGVRDRDAADLRERAGGADAEFIDDAVCAGLDVQQVAVRRGGRIDRARIGG